MGRPPVPTILRSIVKRSRPIYDTPYFGQSSSLDQCHSCSNPEESRKEKRRFRGVTIGSCSFAGTSLLRGPPAHEGDVLPQPESRRDRLPAEGGVVWFRRRPFRKAAGPPLMGGLQEYSAHEPHVACA